MAKYSKECGPDAIDEYDDYTRLEWIDEKGRKYYDFSRIHNVNGTGLMASSVGRSSNYSSHYEDTYFIGEGITELGDKCLSNNSINSVTLPSTIKKIGNQCFRYSSITSIILPESLEKIGENNFPPSLVGITIPSLIEDFPVSNVADCEHLSSIEVSEGNKSYKSYKGMLFDFDMTRIVRCPRGMKGQIMLPNSVKEIGEHCFDGCGQISRIILPSSIESIGDYAFANISMDELKIPNSVKHMGIGCLSGSTFTKQLKLPVSFTNLPESFLYKAIYATYSFIDCIETIGENALDESGVKSSLPEVVSLPNVKVIKKRGLYNATKEYHLYSPLVSVDSEAFGGTDDKLVIRYFSYVPTRINENAFNGISVGATLVVPEHTKLIFENATPWNVFNNIVEMPLNQTSLADDTSISDEEWAKRIQSIYTSKNNADRIFIKDIIDSIKENYININDEAEYKEAFDLLRYNYSFIPAIEPDLASELCRNWPNKYKLLILNSDLAISQTIFGRNQSKAITKESLQELPPISIPMELPELESTDYEVHFSDIQKHLQNELSLAKDSVKIAVSWFTKYSLFKQVKNMSENGVKVQLITNNDLINNGGYCLNFNELISSGVEISLVEYPHLLHDKFCIIDDSVIIDGSYNWTRFSHNNYENIMIIRDNDELCQSFNEEFESLLQKAEYKVIEKMPNAVPERPEYDRSAFRQYITEELDAQAHEAGNERDKITAIHAASKLNPEYLSIIDPKSKEEYNEAFKVIDHSESVALDIANIVTEEDQKIKSEKNQKETGPLVQPTSSSNTTKETGNKPVETLSQAKEKINAVKASNLFMAVDVSGSMNETFSKGYVHNIVKKALESSLSLSGTKSVSVWTFGNESRFLFDVGLDNLNKINEIRCMNEGTQLIKFVEKATPNMKDGTLTIILTDDDESSIKNAVPYMKEKNNVFWQVIAYGQHKNISQAITGLGNVSLVSLDDFGTKTDSEITSILLRDYIAWKIKK